MSGIRGLSVGGGRGEIFTTGQLAKLFGVAPRTVSQWVDAGFLPGYRLPSVTGGPGDRRVTREDALKFARDLGLRHAVEALAAPRTVVVVGCSPAYAAVFTRGLPEGWRTFEVENHFDAASRVAGAFVVGCERGLSAARDLARHLAGHPNRPAVYLLAPDDLPPDEAEALRSHGVRVLAEDSPVSHAGLVANGGAA